MTEYEKIIILQISKIITAGCWRSVKRAGFFGPCSIREKCAVGSGCSDPGIGHIGIHLMHSREIAVSDL